LAADTDRITLVVPALDAAHDEHPQPERMG
jgi:hypothetical protein